MGGSEGSEPEWKGWLTVDRMSTWRRCLIGGMAPAGREASGKAARELEQLAVNWMHTRAAKERSVRGSCHFRRLNLGDGGASNRNEKSRNRWRPVGEAEVVVRGIVVFVGRPLLWGVWCRPWCWCENEAKAAGRFAVSSPLTPSDFSRYSLQCSSLNGNIWPVFCYMGSFLSRALQTGGLGKANPILQFPDTSWEIVDFSLLVKYSQMMSFLTADMSEFYQEKTMVHFVGFHVNNPFSRRFLPYSTLIKLFIAYHCSFFLWWK